MKAHHFESHLARLGLSKHPTAHLELQARAGQEGSPSTAFTNKLELSNHSSAGGSIAYVHTTNSVDSMDWFDDY
jgi:hypothetical protein